jgi:hypothetical protein
LKFSFGAEYFSWALLRRHNTSSASQGIEAMNEKDTAVLLSNGLPQPPVPQRLLELLKDYPDHLARIQGALNDVVLNHAQSIPLFEQAVWALEGQTAVFIREAQAALEAAQESGDAEVIARAEVMASLMRRTRSPNAGLKGMHEIWGYLDATRQGEFKARQPLYS